MYRKKMIMVDGNHAAASVAYRVSEAVIIYPITPSSPMGELSDEWAANETPNLWGVVPEVIEMQSEAGAIGAVHGALQGGTLVTTFTASQGLLLMIPNLYKIAGELTPFCMHVAARSVATHALSIFGDHSDVMACRQTGAALMASGSVQEAQDFACISHAATLRSRIPFIHFFDGFRTSHEIAKIDPVDDAVLAAMMDEADIAAHRLRALTPDRPVIRGTAQNPDVFFQAREACNPFYDKCPEIVQSMMNQFHTLTHRSYNLVDYVGDPNARRVIVMMGSGAETAHETVEHLNGRGESVGLLKVRLFRPFPVRAFLEALPPTVESIAVLDRTKEPGAPGEPLYQDLAAVLLADRQGEYRLRRDPVLVGGRYGLSSKEFTPAMVTAVYDNLRDNAPKKSFTVGIVDDVSQTSLKIDPDYEIEPPDVHRSVFFGLGSDGTVSANKNSIKILGEETGLYAQGYFEYDSKKAGAKTVSHLRISPRIIRSTYLIGQANFVGCHQASFLEKLDLLDVAAPGATFLLNSPEPPEKVWDSLPREVQSQVLEKDLRLYCIDAYAVAREAGMGGRINTIMQACFFAISGILPRDAAIEEIKKSIRDSYGRKGEHLIQANFAAVDLALEHLHPVDTKDQSISGQARPPVVAEGAPDFVRRVTAVIMEGKGDLLPVSAFPVDGTWISATSRWEKRGIALEIPVWDAGLCIQCNKCALVCPHAAIRAKVYDSDFASLAPEGFKSCDYKGSDFEGRKYTIQVAPDDCTGCNLCVMVCPAKDKSNPKHKAIDMEPLAEIREQERNSFSFFLELPDVSREEVSRLDAKGSQFLRPLFEFSGACAGCGETPYIKLVTQLFGDRMLIANATGCSSIYGGNLPTTPYCVDSGGRGPAWSNSLFEDNAEFGLGMRVALDKNREHAEKLVRSLAGQIGDTLAAEILTFHNGSASSLNAQRARIESLRRKLREIQMPEARQLELLADYLAPKSVWLIGGDGWAYDIGFGGLDHVLSQGRDVNVLVLDTEVYSNTGGQASKATPLGAAAKFATAGKAMPKKDLGLIIMSYRNVYVASVAFGANDSQTVKALQEAESYPGPSLVIAYSPCIAHGYDLRFGVDQQKRAVQSGIWPLYRFDPRLLDEGRQPLTLDSKPPKLPVAEYMLNELRFRMIERLHPARFQRLMAEAQVIANRRMELYQQLARLSVTKPEEISR